jgi:lipoprotein NlpD
MVRRFFRPDSSEAPRSISAFWRNCFQRVLKILSTYFCVFFLTACASHRAPTSSLEQPPSRNISHHTVSNGETLYSIAWRYGKDYRDLAAINHISSPYRIYPGQSLSLAGRTLVSAVSPAPKKQNIAPQPVPLKRSQPVRVSSKSLTSKKPHLRPLLQDLPSNGAGRRKAK